MTEQAPPKRRGKAPARKPASQPAKVDEQNQATVEEFEREGLGVAAKE